MIDDEIVASVARLGLGPGCRILVAVSGGPDSVALLDILVRLATDSARRWELRVVHVNHGLREPGADEDERFVQSLARDLGLDIDVVRVDTRAHAKTHRASIETSARELRYAALQHALASWPGDAIATGHTMDDQAETVLLNATRGAGALGLGAMPDVRGAIVRPLLGVRREALLGYLQQRGLGYRIDSTNLDPAFARNRIRREIIPALERIRPGAVQNLARAASQSRDDATWLRREGVEALELLDVSTAPGSIGAPLAPWRALDPVVRRQVLRIMLGHLDALRDVGRGHVDAFERDLTAARRASQAFDTLPGGVRCALSSSRFTLSRSAESADVDPGVAELPVPGEAVLGGSSFSATVVAASAGEWGQALTVCGPFHALCDARAIGEAVALRFRHPGDRLRPLGLGGSKSIQDLFVDSHLAAPLRDYLPLVVKDNSVVWVPGFALDERVAISAQTRRIVHFVCRPMGPLHAAIISR